MSEEKKNHCTDCGIELPINASHCHVCNDNFKPIIIGFKPIMPESIKKALMRESESIICHHTGDHSDQIPFLRKRIKELEAKLAGKEKLVEAQAAYNYQAYRKNDKQVDEILGLEAKIFRLDIIIADSHGEINTLTEAAHEACDHSKGLYAEIDILKEQIEKNIKSIRDSSVFDVQQADKIYRLENQSSEFNRNDVLTLAKIFMEQPVKLRDNPNGCDNIECDYCYSPVPFLYQCKPEMDHEKMIREFKHDKDCPVLIAQDLLTGNEKEN